MKMEKRWEEETKRWVKEGGKKIGGKEVQKVEVRGKKKERRMKNSPRKKDEERRRKRDKVKKKWEI